MTHLSQRKSFSSTSAAPNDIENMYDKINPEYLTTVRSESFVTVNDSFKMKSRTSQSSLTYEESNNNAAELILRELFVPIVQEDHVLVVDKNRKSRRYTVEFQDADEFSSLPRGFSSDKRTSVPLAFQDDKNLNMTIQRRRGAIISTRLSVSNDAYSTVV